jgi:hypothetical protein
MTDRVNGFFVTLDENIREDNAQSTIEAIKHIKGVLTVKANISDISEHVVSERIRHDLYMKISKAIFPNKK